MSDKVMRCTSRCSVFYSLDPVSAISFSVHSKSTQLMKDREIEFETMEFERPSDKKLSGRGVRSGVG
eukprot:4564646-Amphidinium_carterae.1